MSNCLQPDKRERLVRRWQQRAERAPQAMRRRSPRRGNSRQGEGSGHGRRSIRRHRPWKPSGQKSAFARQSL